ncbi:hypothetical protein [Sutcliffiella horikoshii]|uniref:hypothetical protein n=1 Tax=Sutcliffiella horikoshii TaxID=79883 RepID=UPI00384FB582
MKIINTSLTYNHEVPCTDGTFINSYDVQVTIKLKDEVLQLSYSLMEGETVWSHTFAYDQSGYARSGLLSPTDFRELFIHPEVSKHTINVENKLGVNGRCNLSTFSEEEFSTFDFVSFRDLCKQIAGVFHVKPHVYEELGMCSYHAVKFELNDGPIFILCNDYHVAFTHEVDSYPKKFIDHHKLASYFPPPYKVYTVEELNKPFHKEQINRTLTDWEIYSIKHWKPETFGDFLFNYWD